ncbi:MAG: hypothetical protein EZS28_037928 [Streblomastix strix]|uniref:Uncharacterized protein n=1 Tax=Streblomastix strix TaxID=222440 RepID=A0A5J4U6S8_9EUKA|nr:MAG: hypothetical protein EZS28_037928 [Streblomastix strix]
MLDDSNYNDSLILENLSNLQNPLSQTLPISNYHPFLLFTSVGIALFTSHLTQYNFIYPIPFPQPPLSILYIGGQEKDSVHNNPQSTLKSNQKNELNSKKISRHSQQKDVRSLDKLFIASGNTLIIITNGQVLRHTYPYKWFNDLVITNGANWYLPAPTNQQQQPQSIEKIKSPALNYQSSVSDVSIHSQNQQQSAHSSFQSNLDSIHLKIKSSILFIVSASNASMIVDLSTGQFFEFPGKNTDIKELGEGGPEDFQYNPMCINSIVPLPYYTYSQHHSIDNRFLLGVGNGRSGAIHSIGIGHKLQSIMQGKWYEKLPSIFTNVVEPIEPVKVGIDNQKKTISFGSVQGAVVQITSSEI